MRIEGPTGVRRIVVAGGKGLERSKSADAHRRDGRFRAATDHHLGRAALDDLERIADRVRRRGARRRRRGVRPARAITNGNVSGSKINDSARNEEGGDLPRAALQQLRVLTLDDVKSADSRTDIDTDLIQVRLLGRPVRHFYGEIGAGQRDLNVPAHLLELFFLNPVERIEILDLARDRAIETRGVKMCDGAHAALPGPEVFPAFLRADAQRADKPNTCNDNPTCQLSFAP
jgi:hypothetical protein